MLSKFQQYREKLPGFVRNKYFLTAMVFVGWLLFFDRNDIYSQFQLRQDLSKLREERDFFKQEIRKDSIQLRNLINDPEALEKFARETYLMKKDNEDIFVVFEEENNL